jgi:hypothetical protein
VKNLQKQMQGLQAQVRGMVGRKGRALALGGRRRGNGEEGRGEGEGEGGSSEEGREKEKGPAALVNPEQEQQQIPSSAARERGKVRTPRGARGQPATPETPGGEERKAARERAREEMRAKMAEHRKLVKSPGGWADTEPEIHVGKLPTPRVRLMGPCHSVCACWCGQWFVCAVLMCRWCRQDVERVLRKDPSSPPPGEVSTTDNVASPELSEPGVGPRSAEAWASEGVEEDGDAAEGSVEHERAGEGEGEGDREGGEEEEEELDLELDFLGQTPSEDEALDRGVSPPSAGVESEGAVTLDRARGRLGLAGAAEPGRAGRGAALGCRDPGMFEDILGLAEFADVMSQVEGEGQESQEEEGAALRAWALREGWGVGGPGGGEKGPGAAEAAGGGQGLSPEQPRAGSSPSDPPQLPPEQQERRASAPRAIAFALPEANDEDLDEVDLAPLPTRAGLDGGSHEFQLMVEQMQEVLRMGATFSEEEELEEEEEEEGREVVVEEGHGEDDYDALVSGDLRDSEKW